jgi:PiT family inorganic phosphate transporter
MVGVLWLFRNASPGPLTRRFRTAQIGSSAAMALGHGLQDAQKTMGVITLALVAAGYHQGPTIPLWVTLSAAAAISLGTASGGWRVMRTLGRGVIELDPPRGFVAESVGAAILYITANAFRAPVSTTHVITSAIAGVGATKRKSAVRWGVAGDIALAWVLTMPAAGAVAALFSWLMRG